MIDTQRCPLCGALNHCAMAEGSDKKERCWCRSEIIPQTLLDQVPPEAKQRACICHGCAEKGAE